MHGSYEQLEMWKANRCNCLIWAFVMWFKHGGRLKFCYSISGWWIHARWSPGRGRMFEFVPHKYQAGRKFPPPVFDGAVQEVLSVTVVTKVAVDGEVKTTYLDLTPL